MGWHALYTPRTTHYAPPPYPSTLKSVHWGSHSDNFPNFKNAFISGNCVANLPVKKIPSGRPARAAFNRKAQFQARDRYYWNDSLRLLPALFKIPSDILSRKWHVGMTNTWSDYYRNFSKHSRMFQNLSPNNPSWKQLFCWTSTSCCYWRAGFKNA